MEIQQREVSHCTQVATTRPPAARMTSPVIQADLSDARNTASGAISGTRPSWPRGVFPARTSEARFASHVEKNTRLAAPL